MPDENKNKSATAAGDKAQVKKLELDAKTAFKDEKFDEARKAIDELKKLDPENHLANHLLEKVGKAEADKKKRENAAEIKSLEEKLNMAYKAGKLPEISDLIDKIRELDPENKAAAKVETRILKAKASLDAQVKKEKVRAHCAELKDLVKAKDWDKATEKANEILKLDWGQSDALKAIKQVAKEKKVEPATLITVEAPKDAEDKLGFFARIFKKKSEKATDEKPAEPVPAKAEGSKAEGKEEAKPVVSAPTAPAKPAETKLATAPAPVKPAEPAKSAAPVAKLVKPVEAKPAEPVKPAAAPTPAKPATESAVARSKGAKVSEGMETDKDKTLPTGRQVKKFEGELKIALKDNQETDAKHAIEELRKLDPENKAARKAEAKMEKEKAKLEAKANKEKIKGLTGEIKELLKNQEWDKLIKKANELNHLEKDHKVAIKALKEAAKSRNVEYTTLIGSPAQTEAKKEETKPAVPVPAPAAPKVIGTEAIKKTPIVAPAKPAVSTAVPAPAAPKPATPAAPAPAKPIVAAPLVAAPLGAVKKPAAPAPVTPAKPDEAKPAVAGAQLAEGDKGNIFTSLFGKKEAAPAERGAPKPAGSIIDTIVAKTDEKKAAKKEKKKQPSTGEGFLKFSSALLQFSVVFILISAAFFYVQNIDQDNRALALVGIEENFASRLRAVGQELEAKQSTEKGLNKEIKDYQEGYEDKNIEVINKIIEGRLNWPRLLSKLDEVTESVYERNALSQYVQYNNYSYNVDTGKLSVSAELSDPLGRNMTKLAELERAYNNYPRDPDDPDDETAPYFYGLSEFQSFSKSFDKATGRYKTTYSLSFSTKPE